MCYVKVTVVHDGRTLRMQTLDNRVLVRGHARTHSTQQSHTQTHAHTPLPAHTCARTNTHVDGAPPRALATSSLCVSELFHLNPMHF